jgi:hypothetical protein
MALKNRRTTNMAVSAAYKPDFGYQNVAVKMPIKILNSIEKLMKIYDLSRARTVIKLIEIGLQHAGEDVERTSTCEGKMKDNGIPVTLSQGLRKVL